MQRGRLAHAILLYGGDIEALEVVAQGIATVLLEHPRDTQMHPDFFTLRPAGKARMLRIGDSDKDEPNTMRWLLPRLMRSANQGGHKVAVVYEADRMNAATANAFLKTLEEPPARTTILMLTTRPYDLLATIRSRCFNFRLPVDGSHLQNSTWLAWLDSYSDWLARLHSKATPVRQKLGEVIFAYGLNTRFQGTVQSITDELWKVEKAKLTDTLTADELEALETGIRKGIRNRLWREVEEQTRDLAVKIALETGEFPSKSLALTVAALEQAAGLMNLNFKDEAALEAFLLKTMRAWLR